MSARPFRPYPRLRPTQQKGSKPRCHLLTTGTDKEIATRLTDLVGIDGVTVREGDSRLPRGFVLTHEAQLGTEGKSILADGSVRKALRDWWLSVPSEHANTPNWDIATTCSINGRLGLLLFEAKAHDSELRNEERGKSLEGEDGKGVSLNSRRNHVRIGAAIEESSLALASYTGLPWALSRDWNYQMSNRFAWSCKLAELGMPVVLVYLGFLRAEEMRTRKQADFSTHKEWERLVQQHSAPLFPQSVWGNSIDIAGTCFIPIIRSVAQPLSPIST